MNEQEIQSLIDEFKPHLLTADRKIDERAVMMLCRQIERQTRQRAHASAQAVANAISEGLDVRAAIQKMQWGK